MNQVQLQGNNGPGQCSVPPRLRESSGLGFPHSHRTPGPLQEGLLWAPWVKDSINPVLGLTLS